MMLCLAPARAAVTVKMGSLLSLAIGTTLAFAVVIVAVWLAYTW